MHQLQICSWCVLINASAVSIAYSCKSALVLLLLLLIIDNYCLVLGEDASCSSEGTDILVVPTTTGSRIQCFTYVPENGSAVPLVLVAMHGVKRNADRYFEIWLPYARKSGFALLVPELAERAFPGSMMYNCGNYTDADGAPQPEHLWTFNVVETAFEHLKAKHSLQNEKYCLFGHSAGAQFVHRYMLLMDLGKVQLAFAANAGWYTLPTWHTPHEFPYSLLGTHVTNETLARSFGANTTVLVGGDDTVQDEHLRTEGPAMDQGVNRLQRAHHFMALAQSMAGQLSCPLNWRLEVVGGVAHSPSKMAARAAELLEDVINNSAGSL